METFATIYAILIIILAILVVRIINLANMEKERDLLKKVFFESDKIYWGRGDDIAYSVSLSMTKQNVGNKFCYCDFLQFRRDFVKVKTWRYDDVYDSLMGQSISVDYIHASILMINGVGYLPINHDEFRKISMFIRSYIDLNFKQE